MPARLVFTVPAILVALGLATAPVTLAAQTGAVRGHVTSADDGSPIRGLAVTARGAGALALTDHAGRFVLPRVPAGSQVIVFRLLGYAAHEETVTVPEGGEVSLTVAMRAVTYTLGEVSVSAASRTPERIVEAPAAVSVVDINATRDLATTGQAPLALGRIPGVDIVQSGMTDFNVNARGLNSSLNRRVLVLQDGRDLAIAFLGAPQEWNALAVPLDEARRIELVRGPGSALYGANAFAGVLSITTAAPREAPGTRLTIAGGELSTFRVDGRHGGVVGRWGYRLSAGYSQSDSWSRSRTASDSLDLAREYADATDQSQPRNREVRPLNGQALGTFNFAAGEPDPVTSTYVSGRLDHYADNGMVVSAEAGAARVENEVFVTGIGRVQVTKADRPWARLNIASPRFNIMGWYSGRRSVDPQYSLGAGLPLEERSGIYHIEAQANQSFDGERFRVVVGGSYRQYRVNTDSTLMEAADDDRSDDYYSLFGQLEARLSPQLRAVVAGRFDDGTLFEGQVSPKGALVYQPNRDHSVRLTLNRAFQTPNYSEYFLRAPAGAPLAAPAQLEAGLEQYFAGVSGAVAAGLLPPSVTAGLDLSPLPWNFDPQTTVQARGNRTLDVERVTSWEVGYKGSIGRRSFFTVDLYRSSMRDFVTDLLPGVNPAFPTYALTDQGRDVPATLDSLDARLAALGLPAGHPLRAPVPLLRGGYTQLNAAAGPLLATLPDGRRALVVSYTNAGSVIAQGVEVGATVALSPRLSADGALSYFDFEVREQALGDKLLANTPRWKGSFGLTYGDDRLDLNLTFRFVQSMSWAAGIFAGHVPSSQTLNVSGGYRLNRNLRVHGVVTNLFDQQRYHMFGGSVIGRRALAGVTAEF
jgi:iron complex outermembrane receptor protein